ncbi:MAG: iron ABC transporter permease [Bacteroidia bacterium]|nr:iron ABC transporter permease [Candidatus Vicinibacter affinis]MCC6720558.1 iron ABC transporter permease [Bacteroidia bacterium]
MINNKRNFIIISFIIVFVVILFSLSQGIYNIDNLTIIKIIFSKIFPITKTWSNEQELVLMQVRLPRIFLVCFVGANLAVSGSVLQAVFKNPLVSPFILGISSGASLGASIIIVFFNVYNSYLLQLSAFSFSLLAVFLVIGISKIFGNTNTVILILSGVIVSSFFSSIVSLLQYFSETDKLQAIIFWIFGSFSNANWEGVWQVAPLTLIGSLILILVSWKINVISLGDQQSDSLGIDSKKFRIFLIVIVSLMTSSAVAIVGPIGWVGLIIPHIIRMLLGANNFYVLLGSISLGISFLLLIDIISRNSLSVEIPIGIVTSIFGAPFFIYILSRSKYNF